MYWALPVSFQTDIRKQVDENKRKETNGRTHFYSAACVAFHCLILYIFPSVRLLADEKERKNAQQHVNSFGNFCGKMSHLLSWCSLKRQ